MKIRRAVGPRRVLTIDHDLKDCAQRADTAAEARVGHDGGEIQQSSMFTDISVAIGFGENDFVRCLAIRCSAFSVSSFHARWGCQIRVLLMPYE